MLERGEMDQVIYFQIFFFILQREKRQVEYICLLWGINWGVLRYLGYRYLRTQ